MFDYSIETTLGREPPPNGWQMARNANAKNRMAGNLRNKQGSSIYAQRKTVVVPVNCRIKEGRGLRSFLHRGLEKADSLGKPQTVEVLLVQVIAAGRIRRIGMRSGTFR
jgi:hypothetical protein